MTVNADDSKKGIYKNVTANFVLVIPEREYVKYKDNSTNIGEIAIIKKTIKPEGFITVSVSNSGVLFNTSNNMSTVSFTLNNLSDNSKFTGCKFYGDNTSTNSYPLKVSVSDEDWNRAENGSYSATLIFNISYNRIIF